MNLTCFYCQTPFTLSMDQKIAALRKMHAENLHHYDAHCPRCGRANAISRERLEMFTPGWEEAIKEPVPAMPGAPAQETPNTTVPSPVTMPSTPVAPAPAQKRAAPARRRHAPAAKKAAKKATARKAPAKKATAKKKTAAKTKKTTKAKSKSASRKTAKKRR